MVANKDRLYIERYKSISKPLMSVVVMLYDGYHQLSTVDNIYWNFDKKKNMRQHVLFSNSPNIILGSVQLKQPQ